MAETADAVPDSLPIPRTRLMVILGPPLVAQHAVWQHRSGRERTTVEYFAAESLAAG